MTIVAHVIQNNLDTQSRWIHLRRCLRDLVDEQASL